jgi:hypothetical protein
MLYADSRDVFRVYQMSLARGVWNVSSASMNGVVLVQGAAHSWQDACRRGGH